MSFRILGIMLAGAIMTTLGACKTVRNADELQTHLSEVTVAASSYGSEMRDEGVKPRKTIKNSAYHSTTPLTAAGVATVATAQVVEMLRDRPPVLLDVLGGSSHATIPGAHWLPGAGTGKDFGDQTQSRLGSRLAQPRRRTSCGTLLFAASMGMLDPPYLEREDGEADKEEDG